MEVNVVTVVGGVILYKLIDLTVTATFKKINGSNYVTRKECENCKKGDSAAMKGIGEEIATVRKVLLLVAVRMQIPEDKWQELAK